MIVVTKKEDKKSKNKRKMVHNESLPKETPPPPPVQPPAPADLSTIEEQGCESHIDDTSASELIELCLTDISKVINVDIPEPLEADDREHRPSAPAPKSAKTLNLPEQYQQMYAEKKQSGAPKTGQAASSVVFMRPGKKSGKQRQEGGRKQDANSVSTSDEVPIAPKSFKPPPNLDENAIEQQKVESRRLNRADFQRVAGGTGPEGRAAVAQRQR